MSLYNIVSPASLVPGQPEDVSQVLANFQAIQAVLNGGIDDVNIRSTAAIVPSKLAGYPASALMALRGDGSWLRTPPTRQVFTSGSGTYTTPAGCKAILVELIGGGAAGGGAPSTSAGSCSVGGGGGGGAFAGSLIQNPAATYAYAVGAGGTGVANGTGGNGGDTTFGATIVVAKGGLGGGQAAQSAPPAWYANGGSGGSQAGSTGDFAIGGEPGWRGMALAVSAVFTGAGGSAARGGGGGQAAFSTTTTGTVGQIPGGGGSGGGNNQSQGATVAGAPGAAGLIVITEFY